MYWMILYVLRNRLLIFYKKRRQCTTVKKEG